MTHIIIDGSNFSTLAAFYNEIENKLTKGLIWKIGRNLNAFNDVLRGGFGVFEYNEPIKLTWKDSNLSKQKLGWEETIKYLSKMLKNCHPSNIESVKTELQLAKEQKGDTLFDMLVGIIKNHTHIEFELA